MRLARSILNTLPDETFLVQAMDDLKTELCESSLSFDALELVNQFFQLESTISQFFQLKKIYVGGSAVMGVVPTMAFYDFYLAVGDGQQPVIDFINGALDGRERSESIH